MHLSGWVAVAILVVHLLQVMPAGARVVDLKAMDAAKGACTSWVWCAMSIYLPGIAGACQTNGAQCTHIRRPGEGHVGEGDSREQSEGAGGKRIGIAHRTEVWRSVCPDSWGRCACWRE